MKTNLAIGRNVTLSVACLVATVAAWAQQGHSMPGMPGMPGMATPPTSTTPAASPPPSTAPSTGQRPGAAPEAAPMSSQPTTGTQSRADATTPRPPESTNGPMSMPVSDNMVFYQVLLSEVEYTRARRGAGALAWDVQGWVGRDYSRLWVKSEGERQGGRTQDASLELLYSKPVAAFWDVQAGLRNDFGEGARRNWIALGIQGIAPNWFDVEATAYAGSSGRTALRLKTEYQYLLTQRTFLVPKVEANLYGKSDPTRGIGSGLSDVSFGLRLRQEIRREFAPYIGVNWKRRIGDTANFARSAGEPVNERQLVVGIRAWF
jgi:copper resistance protein B